MADFVPMDVSTLKGGFSFKSPSYNWTDTTQNINGGFSFDLPLATAAMFNSTALTFAASNTENAMGFLDKIIGRAQTNVTQATDKSFALQDKSLNSMNSMFTQAMDLKRFEIKKKYSIGNLLKPGSNCFITTAVCGTLGLPDDCRQLRALRKFRDEFMESTEEGVDLVIRYYDLAPRIVEVLDVMPEGKFHYNYMLTNFIEPALLHIANGRNEEAQGVYCAMVWYASKVTGVTEG